MTRRIIIKADSTWIYRPSLHLLHLCEWKSFDELHMHIFHIKNPAPTFDEWKLIYYLYLLYSKTPPYQVNTVFIVHISL